MHLRSTLFSLRGNGGSPQLRHDGTDVVHDHAWEKGVFWGEGENITQHILGTVFFCHLFTLLSLFNWEECMSGKTVILAINERGDLSQLHERLKYNTKDWQIWYLQQTSSTRDSTPWHGTKSRELPGILSVTWAAEQQDKMDWRQTTVSTYFSSSDDICHWSRQRPTSQSSSWRPRLKAAKLAEWQATKAGPNKQAKTSFESMCMCKTYWDA